MDYNQKHLDFFAAYIEANLGIKYVEANYFQLEHRLKEICKQLDVKDIAELYDMSQMKIDGQFKALLFDIATNNETSFFRDMKVFKALSKFVIPELRKEGIKNSISIWSAAASSGQEAYSILMELEELKKTDPLFPTIKMLATDVSRRILKRAEEGIYTQLEVQRGLSAQQILEYFEQMPDDRWKLKNSIRKYIDFSHLNLLHDWGHIGPFDIIFCRNVLIYQSVENKKRVLAQIQDYLRPGGFLILGAAESLFGITDHFEQTNFEGVIFYRKK